MSVRLSYIVPAYNALPHIRETMQSLLAQDYDSSQYEIIVIDDGSTDGTGAYLDSLLPDYDNLSVIHAGPSGGPAIPRNLGIDNAKGEYIFFCDSDDWMELDATTRMLAHADDWGSDVMLVRPKGENGRPLAQGAFDLTLPDADVYKSDICQALGPCKLFRRSLIVDNHLRFPSELPVWEDQPFVLRAYLLANKVSVAADGIYCHWRGHDVGEVSASSTRDNLSFHQVISYLEGMFAIVAELGDPQEAKHLLIPRVLREGLFYAARALDKEPSEKQASLFLRLREVCNDYLSDRFYAICNIQRSVMYRAFCDDDMASFIEICKMDPKDACFSRDNLEIDEGNERVSYTWKGKHGSFSIDASGRAPLGLIPTNISRDGALLTLETTIGKHELIGISQVFVRFSARNKGAWLEFAAERCDVSPDGAQHYQAIVPISSLDGADNATIWDAFMVAVFSNGRRVKKRIPMIAESVNYETFAYRIPIKDEVTIAPYATANGFLSFINAFDTAEVSVHRGYRSTGIRLGGLRTQSYKLLKSIDVNLDTKLRHYELHFKANGHQRLERHLWSDPTITLKIDPEK